jgi:hypothetical protein
MSPVSRHCFSLLMIVEAVGATACSFSTIRDAVATLTTGFHCHKLQFVIVWFCGLDSRIDRFIHRCIKQAAGQCALPLAAFLRT